MQSEKRVSSWYMERVAVIDALLAELQEEFDACDPRDTLHWTSVSNEMSKLEDEKETLEFLERGNDDGNLG